MSGRSHDRGERSERGRRALALLHEIQACTHCAASLPHKPRPVVSFAPGARVLLVGQAPGTRVHATGIPWNDPSGDTLRRWMGLDRETFYDASRIAIVPMGFCYPGKGRSGDLPPRPECAPLWHGRILPLLNIELTIVIGQYAHARYLGERRGATLAATVQNWRAFLPSLLPLPHPSPRNRRWLVHNPWFEEEVVPALQDAIQPLLASADG